MTNVVDTIMRKTKELTSVTKKLKLAFFIFLFTSQFYGKFKETFWLHFYIKLKVFVETWGETKFFVVIGRL